MKLFINRLIVFLSVLLLTFNIYAAELGGEYSKLICPLSLNVPERPYVDTVLTDVVKSKFPRISLKVILEKTCDEECIIDLTDQQIKGLLLLDSAFDKSTKLFSLARKKYS